MTKMITIKKTTSADKDFTALVKQLDEDLKIRDGDDHTFYAAFNKTATLQQAIVAYDGNTAVGSGALRKYAGGTMEIKRMYVIPQARRQGIASLILAALENWCTELGYKKAILETVKNQPEAIHLYHKNNYQLIPNYGQYADMHNSVCFGKILQVVLQDE